MVSTKCGKLNCWCIDGEGHQHARITWLEQGKRNTRAVPEEDDKWLTTMTKAYRDFRHLRQALATLETEIKNDLALLEQEVVKNTRKGRAYLETKMVKSVQKQQKVPKKNKKGKKSM
jgi:hypothetical protein